MFLHQEECVQTNFTSYLHTDCGIASTGHLNLAMKEHPRPLMFQMTCVNEKKEKILLKSRKQHCINELNPDKITMSNCATLLFLPVCQMPSVQATELLRASGICSSPPHLA